MPDNSDTGRNVIATVELSGEYEQIAKIIGAEESDYEETAVIAGDMEEVLNIVSWTGGATKSRIADELPPSVAAKLDTDAVIHVLRVLEIYDLVSLDGNTWRPGPALSPD